MPRSTTEQNRRDAGLCIRCGGVRGEDSTKICCAVCAEKMRRQQREWRQRRPKQPISAQTQENRRRSRAKYYAKCVAAGRCAVCNHFLLTDNEKRHGLISCATCREKGRAKNARARQKRRDEAAGVPEDGPYHWPHGARPVKLPGGGQGKPFLCGLNAEAWTALLNLWETYRKTEIAAGRQPHNRRVSQLVREAIHQWKDRLIGPSPTPHTLIARTITVYLNPDTLRILEWQARACFKGNKSAALRMILITVGSPRPVAIAIPRRRGRWTEEEF